MDVSEIKQKKIKGDYVIAGAMTGKTPDNVRQALNNPKSGNHQPIIEALSLIIKSRETLINS